MPSPDHVKERYALRLDIKTCNRCELHTTCRSPVPFSGPSPNRIVVLGEAPGQNEDAEGRPFVGKAGQFLRGQLQEAGIDDKSVTYVNTVSCYPDGTPTSHHRERCRVNLLNQLRLIHPDYVLVLGSVAISTWWNEKISTIRSQWWRIPEASLNPIWAFATFHPSYILRSGGARSKRGKEFFSDLVVFRLIATELLPVPEQDQLITPISGAAAGSAWIQEKLT